jgi:hypothetical protein
LPDFPLHSPVICGNVAHKLAVISTFLGVFIFTVDKSGDEGSGEAANEYEDSYNPKEEADSGQAGHDAAKDSRKNEQDKHL